MDYKNLFSCKNKVAVVTGGAGLLGRKIVKGLSDFGAKVYIADIDKKTARSIADDLKIKYIYFNIASELSVKKGLKKIIKDCGKIDILINCAYPKTKDWNNKFEDVSFFSWKYNLNSHLGGYFLCCQRTAELMKEQKKGSIINFASIYGIVAPDFNIYKRTKMTMPVAYSVIKAGIIALTKYIASYYSKYNIRANVVSPGGIFNNQPESFVRKYSQKTFSGRMGRPEDIVGSVIYLVSDASSYVTGHNLVVDGGWTVL